MKMILRLAVFCALSLQASDPASQIKTVLTKQIEAWNHGDLPTFVTTYADDCIFVGKQVTHGSGELLAHYKASYPTPATMGHLTFTGMTVKLLDKDVAVVTSEWSLERSAASGGPAGGMFSLVLRRKNGEWKIALDHTA